MANHPRVILSLNRKIEILAELDKGEPVPKVAEKYGIGVSTIYRLRQKRNITLNVVETSKDSTTAREDMFRTKRARLSPSLQMEILEKLAQGETISGISQSYGLGISTVYRIRHQREKFLNNIIVPTVNLTTFEERTRPKPYHLSANLKEEILEELDKGETVPGTAKKYGLGVSTVYRIRHDRNKLLDSIAPNEFGNTFAIFAQRSKSHHLSSYIKGEILDKFEHGESAAGIAQKYGIAVSTAYRIKQEKEKAISTMTEPEISLVVPEQKTRVKPTHLTSNMKKEILDALEKGEGVSGVAKKYGLGVSTVYRIKYDKNKILNRTTVHTESASTAEETTRYRPYHLSMNTKEEIIGKLEQGAPVPRLAEEYGLGVSTVYRIKQEKDKVPGINIPFAEDAYHWMVL